MDAWTPRWNNAVSAAPALPLSPLSEDRSAELVCLLDGLQPPRLGGLPAMRRRNALTVRRPLIMALHDDMGTIP